MLGMTEKKNNYSIHTEYLTSFSHHQSLNRTQRILIFHNHLNPSQATLMTFCKSQAGCLWPDIKDEKSLVRNLEVNIELTYCHFMTARPHRIFYLYVCMISEKNVFKILPGLYSLGPLLANPLFQVIIWESVGPVAVMDSAQRDDARCKNASVLCTLRIFFH